MRLRIQGYILNSTDVTNRYMTIELEKITGDYASWKHRIVVSPKDRGLVYDRYQDVNPGTYPVYLGLTVYYPDVYWDVKVVIKDSATNATLFEKTTRIGNWEDYQHLGNVNVYGPGEKVTLTLLVGTGGSVKVYLPDRTETKTPGTYYYEVTKGSSVTLEAIPGSGYYFDGWYDGADRLVSGSKTLSFCIMSSGTYKAMFKSSTTPPPEQYVLTLNVGPNGKVTVGNTSYTNTSVQLTYGAGATVQLTIEAYDGYQIDSININGQNVQPSSATKHQTTLTMNTNHTVDVTFKGKEKTFDPSEVIREMMVKMMPTMIYMMGMMMMMQMMVGMMQAMAGAFA